MLVRVPIDLKNLLGLVLACCLLGTASAPAQETEPLATEATVQPVSAKAAEDRGKGPADLGQVTEETKQVFRVNAAAHRWTKFPLGAWREIEITTESRLAGGEGINRSVTSQVEKLGSVTGEQYALEVQASVNLAGKRIVGKAMARVLQTATDKTGQLLESHRQQDQLFASPSGVINCEVWDVIYSEESSTRVDHVFYAPDRFPHVMRRETASASATEDGLPPVEEVSTVVALEVPFQFGSETLVCSCVQTVRTGEKGNTVRLSMLSPKVPGGTVSVWTTEFDVAGQRTKWSRQLLIDFGLQPFESNLADRQKPLNRRQLRRERRNQ